MRNAMHFIMQIQCLCLLIHYLVGDWSMRYHSVKSKRTPCRFHTEPFTRFLIYGFTKTN